MGRTRNSYCVEEVRPRVSSGLGDARGISPNPHGLVCSYSSGMDATRPLRDVFTALTGDGGASGSDPGEVLRVSGHADLPDGLAAEAVVSYADTAPIEVAEHLAPFVMANSPVPIAGGYLDTADLEPPSWLDALATAPVPTDIDPAEGLDHPDLGWAEGSRSFDDSSSDGTTEDLGFGHGDVGAGTGTPQWQDPAPLDDTRAAPGENDQSGTFEQPGAFDEAAQAEWSVGGVGGVEATPVEDADHLDDLDDA